MNERGMNEISWLLRSCVLCRVAVRQIGSRLSSQIPRNHPCIYELKEGREKMVGQAAARMKHGMFNGRFARYG